MTNELRLTLPRAAPDASGVVDRLIGLGIEPGVIAEQEEKGRRHISVYCGSARDAHRWRRRLRAERLGEQRAGRRTARRAVPTVRTLAGVTLRVRRVRDADWQEPWKRFLQPFAITRDLRLV